MVMVGRQAAADRPGFHPTAWTDCLDMKKPLPVLIMTQVTPANADLHRNRPAVAEEPYGSRCEPLKSPTPGLPT